jgi:hypothetical protein
MTERVLGTRELNRAVLARQRLLERTGEPLPRVLERMGALQAQYAPSMYIGLWSRVRGLERDALTSALERRAVVQGTLLRSTIHLVSRRDWWPFAAGVRESRRTWWLAVQRGSCTRADMERAAGALRDRLRDGPMSRKAIEELVGKEVFGGIGLWVDLVRAPPSGTWERRRADLFADAESWVGPCDADPDAALELLARRYLGAFGPATVAEFADWAGQKVTIARPVIERVGTRRFRAEDGAELLDLPRAPLPTRRRRRPCDSCRRGTRRCWRTPAGRSCCPRSTARGSSGSRRRSPSRRSSSTGRSPGRGGSRTAGSGSTHSGAWTPRTAAPSTRRASGSRSTRASRRRRSGWGRCRPSPATPHRTG